MWVVFVAWPCDELTTECGDNALGRFVVGMFVSVLVVPLSTALIAPSARRTASTSPTWVRRLALVVGIGTLLPLVLTTLAALAGYLNMAGVRVGDSRNALPFTFVAAIWAAIALPLLSTARRMKAAEARGAAAAPFSTHPERLS
jgi:hypothetical protein